jgi:hypothetical protein
MARGMHKPKQLAIRQKGYDEGPTNSSKTLMHRPGSNKK